MPIENRMITDYRTARIAPSVVVGPARYSVPLAPTIPLPRQVPSVKLPANARFSTVCVHAGQEPDPSTGAIITPIFQTSTYVQDEVGRHKGFEYARTQNPTRAALEQNIAAIEGGRGAFAFASGMAAIGAIASMLKSGDHVVVTDNTYGGTFRLFDKVLTRYGLSFSYVDTSSLAPHRTVDSSRDANALHRDADESGHATDRPRGCVRVSARPRRQGHRRQHVREPVRATADRFGADLVVHSTTKDLNGHSDSVGGIVVGVQDDDLAWLKFIQNAEGAILSPFDSFLVLRGTKTLALRMAQHNINGQALSEFLAGHSAVKRVLYPGLPDHPQHELAKRQMRGFGGMLSFDAGSEDNARRVCNRVRLMSLAESLGGVETLICHPASMTHASVPPERRAAIGLTDSLVRIRPASKTQRI